MVDRHCAAAAKEMQMQVTCLFPRNARTHVPTLLLMSGALDDVMNGIYSAQNAESEIENYSEGGKQTSGDVYAKYAFLSAHY